MILVAAHELEKGFGGRTLFRDVAFGIDEGEHVGLVGPNGAGKSTLLKILAGEINPDDGNVTRKKGLRLGFLTQTPELTPGLTLLDTLLEGANDYVEDLPRALRLMTELELNRFDDAMVVDQLSGGWRKRVALGRELMREPELLLLDEPTNHLDLSSILWLENYLKNASFAVLLITHDRLFLSRVVNRVLDLDPRLKHCLLDVRGSYANYLEAKDMEVASGQRHEQVMKNTLRREREWLSHGPQARLTKQKARIDSAHKLIDDVEQITERNRVRTVGMDFGGNYEGPQKLVEAKGLTHRYGERVLFENLNLLVTRKSRLGLLGDNGTGKSTLVRLLLGLEQPTAGTVARADKLAVAHFEQGRDTLDPKLSVLKNLCPEGDYVNVQGQFLHVRSYLDRFLFHGNKAELPVAKLSGGEQARLRLAQIMMIPAQLLVLDEPTNDLDAETLEVLTDAIDGFGGAVILVSHDRYFMDQAADTLLAFPPDFYPDKKLQTFASYFQWEEWFQTLKRPSAREREKNKASQTRVKLSYKDKFELENMESSITVLEKEIADLTELTLAGDVMSDHQRLHEVHARLASKQAELEKKFERWSELEAKTKG